MAAAPETGLKHITTCRVCGQQFSNWQMDVPIVGQPPSERAVEFVQALGNHLRKKHADKMAAVQAGMQDFAGMLILMLYQSADPHLNASVQMVRSGILHLCRDESEIPSDATILDRVARVGLDQKQQELVVTMIKEVRDRCYRIGAFAPRVIVGGS